MSAVLNQTKRLYRYALSLESVMFMLIMLVSIIGCEYRVSIGILFGLLVGFVPHCLFVFWVFFRRSAKNQPKMTAFYRGEGLKWLATIGLMSGLLIGYREIHSLAFFIGYLLALAANGLMPIILKLNAN